MLPIVFIVLIFLLCHYFNYRKNKLQINRLNPHSITIYDPDKNESGKKYKSRRRIINIVCVIMVFLQIMFNILPFIKKNINMKPNTGTLKIAHTQNDQKKDTSEMFKNDMTEKIKAQKEAEIAETEINDIQKNFTLNGAATCL